MVSFKPVLVKKIPSRNELDRLINQAMKDWNKLNEAEFQSTVIGFTRNKIDFDLLFVFTPNHKEAEVSTSNKIYGYLNDGTAVRYATMGPRFKPKTVPGRIKAGGGQTDVLYVNRNRPRPGIKARKFDESIMKKLKPKFFELVSEAVLAFTEDL